MTIITFKRKGRGTRTDLQAPDEENTMTATALVPARVTVRVLLNFGDVAELVTPEHGPDKPLRVLAADIAREAGLPANELPGREFTAVRDGDTYRGFRLVDDPRQ